MMRRVAVAALAALGVASFAAMASPAAACEADYILAPDNSALSVLFTDLTVEAGGAPAVECTIDVPLELPEGMSLGVYRVDYRGFAALENKDRATLTVNYELGPKGNSRHFKRSVRGEMEDDFAFRENIGAGLMKRVGCGVDARLRGRVTLSLDGKGDSFATLDSSDGSSRHGLVYRFNLKAC